MARPWRIEYAGAFYHIFSRGNDHQDVFRAAADRFSFLKVIGLMVERFDVDIFAYVLMGNHYHLLVRTKQANLSKSMQWLGTTYTTRFNLSHSRTGHLFQGRFKSVLVENDAYLMQLSCYIHRNPLRAGLVERLVDYPWSSYPAYAYRKTPPDWLNTDLILSQFGGREKHRSYREKVQKYAEEEKRLREDIKHGMFYGTQAFIDRLKKSCLESGRDPDIPAQSRVFKDIDPSAIVRAGTELLDCDFSELKKSRRIGAVKKRDRDLLIYLLWQTGCFSNTEIGLQFGLTYSSVSRRVRIFQEQLETDSKLQKEYEAIKSQIKV